MVCDVKSEVGGFYLYPTTSKDCGQEYEYHVYNDKIVVKENGWGTVKTKTIFNGTWKEFLSFCQPKAE